MTEFIAQAVSQYATLRLFAIPNNITGVDKNVDIDMEAEAALIKATIGRK